MQLGDLSVVRQEHQLADPRRVGHPAGVVVVSGQSGVYCEATATWGSSTCGSRSEYSRLVVDWVSGGYREFPQIADIEGAVRSEPRK
jgi:hypothetical protein